LWPTPSDALTNSGNKNNGRAMPVTYYTEEDVERQCKLAADNAIADYMRMLKARLVIIEADISAIM
jgi:hypothetical protein